MHCKSKNKKREKILFTIIKCYIVVHTLQFVAVFRLCCIQLPSVFSDTVTVAGCVVMCRLYIVKYMLCDGCFCLLYRLFYEKVV